MKHSKEDENRVDMSFYQVTDDAVKNASASARVLNAAKKKWERMMLSVTFWNKMTVISCMIAVSVDPLFLYIAYVDRKAVCLGTETRLRDAVLVTRSLTDFTFLFHIVYQLREAVKPVTSVSKRKLVQRGSSKLLFNCWFGNAKAIANNLSWSSFLSDILAILPIPHVLILALFYAPTYGYSENKMTLNYMLLAQYAPRMYRIFISFKLFRKNSSVWLKSAFYFFMYILSSHVIGAFWYFSTVQIQAVCWNSVLNGTVNFQCDAQNLTLTSNPKTKPPLSEITRTMVFDSCIYSTGGIKFNYGSFRNTIQAGYTGPTRFRGKLSYFMWWGLKNLSNFGTSIDASSFVWENCFAILVSGLGLVLFAFLIGHMQLCMQSSEDKKVATDKVKMKEQELQEWMDKNGLPEKLGKEAEKLRREIMTKIRENLKDDQNAQVPRLKHMDERGLRLICQYLKPVTYTEKTIAFRMGEPLDSMLFIMEGVMLIYPTSTSTSTAATAAAAATTTDYKVGRANAGSSSTIRCSLEDGDVYGDEQLLSWASPPDMSEISYAQLPTMTENVKCLSEVEGFVLNAKDLKHVVSMYKLQGKHINSSVRLVVEVERSTTSFARGPSTILRNRINSSPPQGTEGLRG